LEVSESFVLGWSDNDSARFNFFQAAIHLSLDNESSAAKDSEDVVIISDEPHKIPSTSSHPGVIFNSLPGPSSSSTQSDNRNLLFNVHFKTSVIRIFIQEHKTISKSMTHSLIHS
jgi:hypothetical protein